MRRTFSILNIVLIAVALSACGAASANSSAPVGVKVQTKDGSYVNVSPAQLHAMLAEKDFLFINVHTPYEGEIAQTNAFVPYDQIGRHITEYALDRNAKIVLYCRSGHMSKIAAETLVELGYTNVWNLDGGMVAWQSAGFPLIKQKS